MPLLGTAQRKVTKVSATSSENFRWRRNFSESKKWRGEGPWENCGPRSCKSWVEGGGSLGKWGRYRRRSSRRVSMVEGVKNSHSGGNHCVHCESVTISRFTIKGNSAPITDTPLPLWLNLEKSCPTSGRTSLGLWERSRITRTTVTVTWCEKDLLVSETRRETVLGRALESEDERHSLLAKETRQERQETFPRTPGAFSLNFPPPPRNDQKLQRLKVPFGRKLDRNKEEGVRWELIWFQIRVEKKLLEVTWVSWTLE